MKILIFVIICTTFISYDNIIFATINLETKISSFIIETKQIKIPEYEYPFNPSIVRWNNKLLLSFRIYDKVSNLANQIGLIFLNNNFEPISKTYILNIEQKEKIDFYINKNTKIREQDPRLIVINNKVKITYNNFQIGRMFVADLDFENDKFVAKNCTCILNFDESKNNRIEKNWMPFEYNNNLLLIYSLQPHKILKLNNNYGKIYANTPTNCKWEFGELRGGTPALLVNGKYLSFFHSSLNMSSVQSKEKNIEHFFMGAYTFSRDYPFNITHISPEPICGSGFYTGKNYKLYRPLKVIFPAGFIYDKNFIWVFLGKQDREIHVIKLDKKKLLDSLITI